MAAATAAALLVALGLAVSPFRLLNAIFVRPPDYGFPELSPDDELAEAARRIADTYNELYGQRTLNDLERQLAAGDGDPAATCRLRLQLAEQLVRRRDLNQALTVSDEAVDLAETLGDTGLVSAAHRVRMLAQLRRLQEETARSNDGPAALVFPPQPLTSDPASQAAREALHSLRQYRAAQPPDTLGLVWLENVLAALLGEHPQSVAGQDRLDLPTSQADDDIPRFTDAARLAGLAETGAGGGVAIGDIDRDGFLDLVISSAAPDEPLKLMHNNGDGAFVDRGSQAGLGRQLGGRACQLVDYNNDGLLDIFVLRGGWLLTEGRIRNSLMEQQADGTFRDVTRQAGLAYPAYPTQSACWGDYDNDGDLDVFVGNESLVELIGLGQGSYPSHFFQNNGDGTFRECAAESGLVVDRLVKGAAAGDYDNDGDLDLYVSTYSFWNPAYGVNLFFQNEGRGKFTETARKLGVMEPAQSVAAWFFDFDHDGWLDLFVCPYGQEIAGDPLAAVVRKARHESHQSESPRMYYNLRGRRFRDDTAAVGLDYPYLTLSAACGDLDNDGYQDVYLGTGGPQFQILLPNVMLRNAAAKRFVDVTSSGGFGLLFPGQSVALADLDNDGDQDAYADVGGFYKLSGQTKALLLNPGTKSQRFLKVSLLGQQNNRQGLGARVRTTVELADGAKTFHHALASGAAPADRLEIGLGPATKIVELEVVWPASKTPQTFQNVPLDSWIRVTEGQAEFERLPLETVDFQRQEQPTATADGP